MEGRITKLSRYKKFSISVLAKHLIYNSKIDIVLTI